MLQNSLNMIDYKLLFPFFLIQKESPMSDLPCYGRCCSDSSPTPQTATQLEFSRRSFLAMGGVIMGGLSYTAFQSALMAADAAAPVAMPPSRKPLIVKPVLVHDLPQRRPQTSWRNWGGIETAEQAAEEVLRIKSELAAVKKRADYPVEFMDISTVTHINQMNGNPDMEACDTILLYGAGHGVNGVENFNKDVVFFQRWRSGPVYLQYEIIIPRYLRQHTDSAALMPRLGYADVVTDKTTELDWRFRALCGLKNTLGSQVVTIGGASAWAQLPGENVPDKVSKLWGFKYHDVNYDELGKLIREAKADAKTMERARKRADAYLKIPGTRLETTNDFFVYNFLLDDLFRVLMQKVGTNQITINSCMGTIMPASETTACLALSTLQDDGYLAFCESDFVSNPTGVLLGNITGKPIFMCNPNFPHDNIMTFAHCSAPRKMDGKTYDPVRILTHFESDYGAAPHIEIPLGTETTHIVGSFSTQRWVGFKGKVVDVPFRPICRTQIDVRYEFPDMLLADRMPGFHWMTCYGDYRKEVGYALRRVGIEWDNLDEVPTKMM